jgi:outer membrane protein assembly factor BamA
LLLPAAAAQDAPGLPQAETRAGEIKDARARKQTSLKPDGPSALERKFEWVQRHPWILPVASNAGGFGYRFGGLFPGAGFAVGPAYGRNDLLNDTAYIRAYAVASTRQSYMVGVQSGIRRLWRDRAFVDFDVARRDLTTMPYYGPGPDSQRTGRSNYRLEDNSVEARPGLSPIKGLRIGAVGGFSAFNVGPGTSPDYISAERQYSPAVAPGIDQQTSFWRTGGFATFDWRDKPGGPISGGNYAAQYLTWMDRGTGQYNFQRLDLDAQQYIPFLNRKRVIALRGLASLTDHDRNRAVPFYLQPTLGGPDMLRGFRPFRFYGSHRIAASAEYRFEASTALEVAVFADSGKIIDRLAEWNKRRVEMSYGVGFRLKSLTAVAARLDLGFSREGFQVWFRFNNVF